jgi:hypothetical protein
LAKIDDRDRNYYDRGKADQNFFDISIKHGVNLSRVGGGVGKRNCKDL